MIDFQIRVIEELEEINQVSSLFDTTWGTTGRTMVSTELMRALTHSGSYLAGAFESGRIIGALLGFIGLSDRSPILHSHVLAVTETFRRSGVGYALKQHQRSWAVERDIDLIAWTFDPLVSRNARFNLCKLGAQATEYLVDFYGSMHDSTNAGDESDRLLIHWGTKSPTQSQRLSCSNGSWSILESVDGRPQHVEDKAGEKLVSVCIPDDILSLRLHHPDVARDWRVAVRDTLGREMKNGSTLVGLADDGRYILRRR